MLPNKSSESRVIGDEPNEDVEPDPREEWPRVEDESEGDEAMVQDVADCGVW